MKLVHIKTKKQNEGFIISTEFIFGINKRFANNFFKEEKDARKFKLFLEKHREDWFKYYYLIPYTYIVPQQLEGKFYQVTQTGYKLHAPKKEDELDF